MARGRSFPPAPPAGRGLAPRAMRDRTYRQVEATVRSLLEDSQLAILQRIAEADEGAITAIGKIQPAHVEMSQELADEITRKLRGPLTIPQEMSDWIRQEASYHDVLSIARLGYSASAPDVHWTLRTDGTLQLEIKRPDGSRWWIGVWGPPERS